MPESSLDTIKLIIFLTKKIQTQDTVTLSIYFIYINNQIEEQQYIKSFKKDCSLKHTRR